jgi:hypothetical protein
MNKKQIVLIIGVVLTISVSIVILNYYISEREFEARNTPGQLREIFSSCACTTEPNRTCPQPLIVWQNSTHYIDNSVCTFLEIHDGYVIPIKADRCPNGTMTIDGKCKLYSYGVDPIYSIILIALIPVTLIIIFVFKSKTKSNKN